MKMCFLKFYIFRDRFSAKQLTLCLMNYFFSLTENQYSVVFCQPGCQSQVLCCFETLLDLKNNDLVREVKLTEVNPIFTKIKFPDGRESTVLLQDLAPLPPSLPRDRILNADEQSFSEQGGDVIASHDINQPVHENNCEVENSPMTDSLNDSVYNNILPR